MSTDSTRHKSKNGETHNEATADFNRYVENLKNMLSENLPIFPKSFVEGFNQGQVAFLKNIDEEFKQEVFEKMSITPNDNKEQLSQSSEEKPVRSHFYNRDITEFKFATFDSLTQAKRFFQNSTFEVAFYYDFKTEEKLLEEVKPQGLWQQMKKRNIFNDYLEGMKMLYAGEDKDTVKCKYIENLGWQIKRGNRVEYKKPNSEVGGIKETEGKLDYSEINFKLLDLMAKRFMDNKVKYPKGNTKKDLDKNEILWAAFRHIRKMIQPIENDPETFEDHLAAVSTNMSIILDQLEK